MAGEGEGTTNEEPGTAVDVPVDCDILWSAAHQFAYLRLSEGRNDNEESREVNLLDSYHSRAKRIAGTYAKFYLEQDEGGDPSKKGRYYWMALGAFASKTVACLLDSFAVQSTAWAGLLLDDAFDAINEVEDFVRGEDATDTADFNIISEGLGLGNFWLFMDIAPWHWFYNQYPDQFFDGMSCGQQRDAQKLVEIPKQVVTQNLQWANYALSKINDLKPTNYMMDGMKLVGDIELEIEVDRKASIQLKHLRAIANHEQEMILQKLIYNHPAFTHWIKMQRGILKVFSPAYELVFTSGCETDYERLKSEAPDALELEILGSLDDGADSKTRMGWIGQAAKDFHELMQEDPQFMESQLRTIATWTTESDGFDIYLHPSSFD